MIKSLATFFTSRVGAVSLIILGVLLASHSAAQEAEDTNPDPVFVFNRVCYAQVPNVEAIETMALKLAWKSIDNDALEEFKNVDKPDKLVGWDVQVGERLFRVGVSQSGLAASMKKAFPDFTAGRVTACSMVLDDQQDPAEFLANMQTLAGKEPLSVDVDEGLFRTTTWAGGNQELKVLLVAKATKNDRGGLLNVTVIQK